MKKRRKEGGAKISRLGNEDQEDRGEDRRIHNERMRRKKGMKRNEKAEV